MDYLGVFVLPVLIIAALVVIGVVLAPRAGAGRGRMWAGLTVLIVVQVLSPIWQLTWVQIIAATSGPGRITTISAMQVGYAIFSGLLSLVGIALLASAATIGRDQGFVPPAYPGAPPGSAGGSPYVTGPDQPAPPR